MGITYFVENRFFFFCGSLVWLADKLHFILSYEAGFYKPTVLKFHPPFLQDYSICNNARLISTYSNFCSRLLIQMNGAWKLVSGGLNPRPLSHESSALTTRPRLLAQKNRIVKKPHKIDLKNKWLINLLKLPMPWCILPMASRIPRHVGGPWKC